MTTLTELIVMCSLASTPHINDTLHQVILAHSGGQPLSIFDATTSQTYQMKNAARAARVTEQLERSGHRLNIGLAGLSTSARARLQITPKEALEPCKNISFASLELERVFATSKRRDADTMHRMLAAYFAPQAAKELQAMDWGARVLAVPRISVSAQIESHGDARLPSFTYESARPRIFVHATQQDSAPTKTPAKMPAKTPTKPPGEAPSPSSGKPAPEKPSTPQPKRNDRQRKGQEKGGKA